jgi:hypothetical protein
MPPAKHVRQADAVRYGLELFLTIAAAQTQNCVERYILLHLFNRVLEEIPNEKNDERE